MPDGGAGGAGGGHLLHDAGRRHPAVQPGLPGVGRHRAAGAALPARQRLRQGSGGRRRRASTSSASSTGAPPRRETCIQTSPGQAGDGPCIGTKNGGETIYSWSGQGSPPTQAVRLRRVRRNDVRRRPRRSASPSRPSGQPCTSDRACVPRAYCAFAGTSAQCAARLPDGASCAHGSHRLPDDVHLRRGDLHVQAAARRRRGVHHRRAVRSPPSCVNGACGGGLADIGLAPHLRRQVEDARLLEERRQLPVLVHLGDDVAAADELPVDVELREGRPAPSTPSAPGGCRRPPGC